MGNKCCQEIKGENGNIYRQITAMTLNYCGIAQSPFEFYLNEYEHQLKAIGNIFEELCKVQFREFIEIDNTTKLFGKIELKFKKGRYSPMFDKKAGIEEVQQSIQQQYRFLSQKQFSDEWNKAFDIYRQKDAKFNKLCGESGQEKLEFYKKNVKKYDFLMFKALLVYVYRHQSFQTCLKNKENPIKYLNIIEPLFEFSFLDKANKLSKFEYGFRKTNPDVYFIQQICDELIQFMERRARRNYWWIADEDQIVIIKKQSFHGQQFQAVDLTAFGVPDLSTTQNDNLIAPLAMGSTSHHYLFICVHFSSRDKENKKQMEYLKQLLNAVISQKIYENVVIGGDLNSFVNQFPEGIDFFPKKETEITTFKKRTKTQAQIKKCDIRDKRSIDKIITNTKILEGEITLIDGTKPDQYEDDQKPEVPRPQEIQKNKKGINSNIKMMLPCDVHPFDQFLVKTKIRLNVRLPENEIILPVF